MIYARLRFQHFRCTQSYHRHLKPTPPSKHQNMSGKHHTIKGGHMFTYQVFDDSVYVVISRHTCIFTACHQLADRSRRHINISPSRCQAALPLGFCGDHVCGCRRVTTYLVSGTYLEDTKIRNAIIRFGCRGWTAHSMN